MTQAFVRLAVVVGVVLAAGAAAPAGSWAATCSDYENQAEAQRAADTRDADGDGIYCESLPCPCLKPGESGGGEAKPDRPAKKRSCTRTKRVFRVGFSKTKYPEIRRHYRKAVRAGWPRVLVLNRKGADARRDRLLDDDVLGLPTREGYDRDEYPPAIGRGRGPKALRQGSNPTGWKASVMYVPSSENRSHGSTMSIKLRRFCNGQRFRYTFY